MSFHVGQKIVCINGNFKDSRWYRSLYQPKQGHIYTIRDFAHAEYVAASDSPSGSFVYLVEIINPPVLWYNGFWELAWPLRRFRPVIERKTDISIFTKILDDVRAKEPT